MEPAQQGLRYVLEVRARAILDYGRGVLAGQGGGTGQDRAVPRAHDFSKATVLGGTWERAGREQLQAV